MNSPRTKRITLSLVAAFPVLFSLASCQQVVLLAPYDEATDNRLQDYREGLNTLVKRAGSNKGTAAGTFEAAKDSYLELEAKIEGLVQRATMQDVGAGCKLDDKTWSRIKGQLKQVAGLPRTNSQTGDGSGCVPLMLTNVQKNLTDLESVHKDPAQCASQDPNFATCLRPDAVKDLLTISNQTIDAVLFVERVLKRHEELN